MDDKAEPPAPSSSIQSSKFKTILQFIPVASVTIAALSFFVTQGLRKKEMTCTYMGVDNLIHLDRSSIAPALKVQLNDKAIQSLDKINLVIQNDGASAIRGEDIKEPVGLLFPEGTNILNASVDGTNPSGFGFTLTKSEERSRFVQFNFALLNSGDAVYISVYAYNSSAFAPKLVGRIVDVRELKTIDGSRDKVAIALPFIQAKWLRTTIKWLLLMFNGGVCIFLASWMTAQTYSSVMLIVWRNKWGDKRRRLYEEYHKVKYPGTAIPDGEYLTKMYEHVVPEDVREKSGIPKPPEPSATGVSDVLSFYSILGSIALLTGLGAAYIAATVRTF